jgi:hypothetical protein
VTEYDEHPSKASAWRDGRFVVLPDAESADCTVWVGAEQHSEGAVKWEGLLARRLGPDRARICAVPFWVYDLNLGDEVALIDSAEAAPVVTAVVKDAGNCTFRVVAGQPDDDEWWRQLMVELEEFDCWFDVRSAGFLALSAPAEHAEAAVNCLNDREKRRELRFDSGRSKPPTS